MHGKNYTNKKAGDRKECAQARLSIHLQASIVTSSGLPKACIQKHRWPFRTCGCLTPQVVMDRIRIIACAAPLTYQSTEQICPRHVRHTHAAWFVQATLVIIPRKGWHYKDSTTIYVSNCSMAHLMFCISAHWCHMSGHLKTLVASKVIRCRFLLPTCQPAAPHGRVAHQWAVSPEMRRPIGAQHVATTQNRSLAVGATHQVDSTLHSP